MLNTAPHSFPSRRRLQNVANGAQTHSGPPDHLPPLVKRPGPSEATHVVGVAIFPPDCAKMAPGQIQCKTPSRPTLIVPGLPRPRTLSAWRSSRRISRKWPWAKFDDPLPPHVNCPGPSEATHVVGAAIFWPDFAKMALGPNSMTPSRPTSCVPARRRPRTSSAWRSSGLISRKWPWAKFHEPLAPHVMRQRAPPPRFFFACRRRRFRPTAAFAPNTPASFEPAAAAAADFAPLRLSRPPPMRVLIPPHSAPCCTPFQHPLPVSSPPPFFLHAAAAVFAPPRLSRPPLAAQARVNTPTQCTVLCTISATATGFGPAAAAAFCPPPPPLSPPVAFTPTGDVAAQARVTLQHTLIHVVVFDVKRLIASQFDNSGVQPDEHFFFPVFIGAASPTSSSTTVACGDLSVVCMPLASLPMDTFRSNLEPIDVRDTFAPNGPIEPCPAGVRGVLAVSCGYYDTVFPRSQYTPAARICPGPGELRVQSSAARTSRLWRTGHELPSYSDQHPPTGPPTRLRNAAPLLSPTRADADETHTCALTRTPQSVHGLRAESGVASPAHATRRVQVATPPPGTKRYKPAVVLRLVAARRLHSRDAAELDVDTDTFPPSRFLCSLRAFRARAAACAVFTAPGSGREISGACVPQHQFARAGYVQHHARLAARPRPPWCAMPVLPPSTRNESISPRAG
ncbi:hypothetical protein B0H11DRAFT_2214846 [Mycena galericulata]|nr:hypothetical protein B0H11DRAFT_2214846 [Mycena galericulata]